MSFLPLTVKKFNQFSATGWIPTRYSLASQLAYEVSVGSRHERSKVAIFHKIVLRRNAAKVPVTSEQKLCTKSIKKKVIANVQHQMSKTNFDVHLKHFQESTGEMKQSKIYRFLHNFSELWNSFYGVVMGHCNYLSLFII